MKEPQAEREGIRLVGHLPYEGGPGGMQLMLKDDVLYVGRPGAEQPMLIIDVSTPAYPQVRGRFPTFPGTTMPKCQVHGNILLVNYEQRGEIDPRGRHGWGVFDISQPFVPRELAYVDTGGRGAHRMWWAGEPHCYISGRPKGFRERMLEIYDMRDPEHPRLAGRWWNQGLWEEGGELPPPPARNGPGVHLHHGIYSGGRLYCGFWDAGVIILDVHNPEAVGVVARIEWEAGEGKSTHTALPLPFRKLLAVVDEANEPREVPRYFRLLNIEDETAPHELSRWRPDHSVFGNRPGRLGPHNLHEHRPGLFQSHDLLFATFYNAGLQVIDIRDPARPTARAYYVPHPADGSAPETNDILVAADGRIFITDRGDGGLHILELE